MQNASSSRYILLSKHAGVLRSILVSAVSCKLPDSIIFKEPHPAKIVANGQSNALIAKWLRWNLTENPSWHFYICDQHSSSCLSKPSFSVTFVLHVLVLLHIPDIVNLPLNKPSQAMTNSHGDRGEGGRGGMIGWVSGLLVRLWGC